MMARSSKCRYKNDRWNIETAISRERMEGFDQWRTQEGSGVSTDTPQRIGWIASSV
jgi:hypothetical protein